MIGKALPPGWVQARLDEVAEVRLGRQRSPKNHTGDQMRPYLRAGNLTWRGIDVSDVNEMNFTDEEVDVYRLEAGDVLLSEASGSASEVGKPGVWRGQLNGDICFQNTLLRVRPEEGVDSDFLYHRFLHEGLRGGFAESSRGVGIHHLGAAKLAALELDLPPAEEQLRIADANSRHHELIDAVLADLLALHRRVTRLTDATLNDVLRRARAAAGDTTATANVADITGGLQKQPKRHPSGRADGMPFLRVANVGRRTLDLTDVHRILVADAERERVTLRSGDLLVVEGNGSPNQIGRAALWRGSISPCTHQNHLIRVRPMESLLPDFLELVWNAPSTITQLKEVASTTSGLYTLSIKKVGNTQIPVPSLAVQQVLVAEAEERLRLAEVTLRSLDPLRRRLDLLRQTVLAEAFAGRLLPQDPNDEPAKQLLKRIAEDRAAAKSAARARKPRTAAKTRPWTARHATTETA